MTVLLDTHYAVWLAIAPEQAAAPLIEPLRHKDPFDDPFDALLLTQAQELGVSLLTRDGLLRGHPLAYFAQ